MAMGEYGSQIHTQDSLSKALILHCCSLGMYATILA
jgi:hypothetical protein